MKLKKFSIKSFQDKDDADNTKTVLSIKIDSNFVGVKLLPDGIYAFFEETDEETDKTVDEIFYFIKGDADVPEDSYCVDILDTVVVRPDATGKQVQHFLLFPVYRSF